MPWTKSNRPSKPLKPSFEKGSGSKTVPKSRRRGKAVRTCKQGEKPGKNRCVGPRAKGQPRAPQANTVSSSMFATYKRSGKHGKAGDFTAGALESMCERAGPKTCVAQVGYRKGRRVIRFCNSEGKPGHVVNIHGRSPATVRKIVQDACEAKRKSGKYPKNVANKSLGGTRKRRKNRKSRSR